jgi:hypothetical protein
MHKLEREREREREERDCTTEMGRIFGLANK